MRPRIERRSSDSTREWRCVFELAVSVVVAVDSACNNSADSAAVDSAAVDSACNNSAGKFVESVVECSKIAGAAGAAVVEHNKIAEAAETVAVEHNTIAAVEAAGTVAVVVEIAVVAHPLIHPPRMVVEAGVPFREEVDDSVAGC